MPCYYNYYVILCYLYYGLVRRAPGFNCEFCTVFPPRLICPTPKWLASPPQWASSLHVAFQPPPRALNSHLEVESCRAVINASQRPPFHAAASWPNWLDLTHCMPTTKTCDLLTSSSDTSTRFLQCQSYDTHADTSWPNTSTQVICRPCDNLWPHSDLANQVASHSPSTSKTLRAVKSCQSRVSTCQTHKTVSLPFIKYESLVTIVSWYK